MAQKDNARTLSDLEKQVDDVINQIEDVLKMGGDTSGPDTDFADVTGSGKDNADDWKRPEKRHTHQVGSPVRGNVGKAAPDGEDDPEQRLSKAAELLGLEPADLVKILAKASKDDDGDDDGDVDDSDPTKKAAPPEDSETVLIEGQTISKAEVGEGVFNVLKAQSEKIEKQRLDIQKAQDEAELEKLKKRADDQYSHVPGTTDERAQILKAVSSMPESLRKSMEKVLLQSEKLAKSAFERVGSSGGRDPADMQKSKIDFEKKISEIVKRDSCTRTEAMAKARVEDPEAFKAFQGNGN